MITELAFLPLLFNREDEYLWDKLKKLPTEKCSEITKQALREIFQDHGEFKQASPEDVIAKTAGLYGVNDLSQGNKVNDVCESDELEDELRESPEPGTFSLDSLFEMSPAEVKPDPVQNLLSIIGKEEDEEVLRLFRGTEDHKEE